MGASCHGDDLYEQALRNQSKREEECITIFEGSPNSKTITIIYRVKVLVVGLR